MAARSALHEVGGQRERRAGETDQRHVAKLSDQQRSRHQYRLNRLWIKWFHGGDIGGGAHRVRDHRPNVGDDVQIHAGRP
ncbi:Uncharacterised protein [Mycobacterium tuberculosis]|uniref:Uncharacterized protein n=1 Tax=Mycobacterium tuberculosis TaxID=1773 RepID=A0A655J1C9_MYCTX|nr:Uncharacterised protein [Mycobacterium tuberculosis]CFE68433.1 Uncharacterised protein [Mycobacterium tuberculosis]CFR40478.1 Uncharacterised protein [Mycobacterium tuberculosis]CFR94131.1 Uncharacterised protein [Mycobacterium tuberculosis]CFS20334.1 Uncharacterised protein [Mycobacterium tuberculosis]